MSNSVFASPFRYLSSLVTSPKSGSSNEVPDLNSPSQYTSPSTKRKAGDEEVFVRRTKRRATSTGHDALFSVGGDNDSTSSPDLEQRAGLKTTLDRSLMPPPATPNSKMRHLPSQRINSSAKRDSNDPVYDDDAISFVSTTMTKQKLDPLDIDAMEGARRHAAAVSLPANSGIWSQTERELYFHLAYRGFEPLLPQNWMIDFETLPLSVFAHENSTDPALIQNVRDNQFRAGHALRRLFEAGHDARDRGHVSPGVRRERVLEKSVKRYLYWALTDVGLRPRSRTKYIPFHIVVARKRGQSTLQTLEDVATKLQSLSIQHQKAHNIRPSVETDSSGHTDADQTRVANDDDASTPTLIGLVVISAVLIVVTLSPFASSMSENVHDQLSLPPSSDPSAQKGADFNADRLRIIAELDFSQKDQDVWNALGVAIAAMQIRREALKVNCGFTNDDLSVMDWDGMSNVDSRLEDDLGEMSTMSRLQLDDKDPDL